MRFAARDLESVRVSKRIEPKVKRLDEEESYGEPYYIWAVVRPIKSAISVSLYGERAISMRSIQSTEPLELAMKVEYDGAEYKVIEADQWTQHWAGVMEKV